MGGRSNKGMYIAAGIMILISILNFSYNIVYQRIYGGYGANVGDTFESTDTYYSRIYDTYDEERLFRWHDYSSLDDLANAYLYFGEYEEALVLVDKILMENDTMGLRITKYNALTQLYRYDEANDLVTETLDTFGSDLSQLDDIDKLNLYYWMILDGQYLRAIDGYMVYVMHYGSLTSEADKVAYQNEIGIDVVFNNIAWAYNLLGEYETAKMYALLSLNMEPDDPITLNNLGNAYYGNYEFEKAIEAYEQAIDINPLDSEPIYGLAVVCTDMKKLNRFTYWQMYVDLEPFDEEALYQLYLGNLEYTSRKYETEPLERLVNIDPTSLEYSKLLALMYLDKDQPIMADLVLKDFRDFNGDFQGDILEAYYTFESGDLENGYSLFSNALYDYDISFWQAFQIGLELYQAEDPKYLDYYFDEVAYLYSESSMYELAAEIYYDQMDYPKLLEAASGMIETDITYGYGYEMLADAQFYLGDYDGAFLNYEKAQKISGDSLYLSTQLLHTVLFMEDYENAQDRIDALMVTAPNEDEVKIAIARFEKATGDTYGSFRARNVLKDIFYQDPYAVWVLFEYPEFESFRTHKDFNIYVEYYYEP